MADLFTQTPNYGFPYPLAGDSVQNTYARIQNLAERIEETYSFLGIDVPLVPGKELMQSGDVAGGSLSGTYPDPDIASDVVLLGNPTTTTQATTDDSTRISTTAHVKAVFAEATGQQFSTIANHIADTTSVHGIPDTADIVYTTDTGTVTSTMIADDTIVDADINASAAIVDTKLDTIATAGKVDNSATTATDANTADAIVARDANGSFSAEEINLAGANFDILNPAGNGEGTLAWSIDDGSLVLGLEGGHVQLPIGQKQVIYAKNSTGTTISKMAAIMAVGAAGDRIDIAPAVADGSVNAMYMLGIAAENINDDTLGYVVTNGYVRNVNTNTWPVGTVLYFDPSTPGGLTTVAPVAPDISLPVAIVTKQNSSSGILYVRMKNGEYLDEIHDVKIDPLTLADGDILKYNASLGIWENVFSDDIELHATTHELGGTDELELDPTQITGIAVVDTDPRLTDARAPTAHDTTHELGGTDELALDPTQITGIAVIDTDPRLSDARTPTSHAISHELGGGDQLALDPTQITGTAVIDTDPRLTDARTPTAHVTTHELGGTDEIEIDPTQVTGIAVVDTDARLTDARTPTIHATSHELGGTDELELDPTQITGIAVVDTDSRLTDARNIVGGSANAVPYQTAADTTSFIPAGNPTDVLTLDSFGVPVWNPQGAPGAHASTHGLAGADPITLDPSQVTGTAITQGDTGTVTSTIIADDTILDADINSAADIAPSKILGTAVTQGDTGTVSYSMLASAVQALLVPSGSIQAFGGTSLPTGYLWCDGSLVSKSTYADLYAALGVNRYGTDTLTDFYLPDLRSRFPRGTATTSGATSTNNTNTHNHTFTGSSATTSSNGAHNHSVNGASTSSGGEHNHNNHGASTGGPDSTVIRAAGNNSAAHWTHLHGVNGTSTSSTGGHNHNTNGANTSSDGGNHTHTLTATGSNSSDSHVPAHVEVNYIIKT